MLDVKPAEIITAFCKSEFPKDIEDDVKSIEDAINEATIEMRKAKEKMK